MWRMCLVVFASERVAMLVRGVETVTKSTGIGGVIGNKGGVLISMLIGETKFCFINCHLAAKPKNLEIRK